MRRAKQSYISGQGDCPDVSAIDVSIDVSAIDVSAKI